jgi:hypothetical protein
MNRGTSAHPVLGEQGWAWLQDGEMSLLPAAVRPSRLRWAWLALAVVVVGLALVAVLIGARL